MDRPDGFARWWTWPPGPRNTISDVADVSVGHVTLLEDSARTGVTAVLPHGGDLYTEKVPAAATVINGFGKSVGLLQLVETGEIETPILLTNTFAVPACATALIRDALMRVPEIGRTLPTVNPLVLECNDGRVNDIRSLTVSEGSAQEAIAVAAAEFEQGTVGAGTGMRTFGMAGGVGSASRVVRLSAASSATVGVLVLSNFGVAGQLRLCGRRIDPSRHVDDASERGSIIIVMATDAPLESRQLGRLSRRAAPALGRLGSFVGHGSGDVCIAFSTAYRLHYRGDVVTHVPRLHESRLDPLFHGAVEAVEEAVCNALLHARGHVGHDGTRTPTLRERLSIHHRPPAEDGLS